MLKNTLIIVALVAVAVAGVIRVAGCRVAVDGTGWLPRFVSPLNSLR